MELSSQLGYFRDDLTLVFQGRSVKLNKTRYPVSSVAQLVERRSRNPKMRVQMSLETTNFSLFFVYIVRLIRIYIVFHISEGGSGIYIHNEFFIA